MTVTFSLDILPMRLHLGALTVRIDEPGPQPAAGAPAAVLPWWRCKVRNAIKRVSGGWTAELSSL